MTDKQIPNLKITKIMTEQHQSNNDKYRIK